MRLVITEADSTSDSLTLFQGVSCGLNPSRQVSNHVDTALHYIGIVTAPNCLLDALSYAKVSQFWHRH